MTSILRLAASLLGSLFRTQRALVLENLALRQQLAVYQRTRKCPRLRRVDRAFWVCLSRFWGDWRIPLVLVKPDTVIRWHRQGFKLYWRWKSRTQAIRTIPR